MILLSCKGLKKSFEDGRPLFSGVDLEVSEGDFTFLMGKSGSGKSTLLKALVKLTPLDEGEIFWKGEPIQKGREVSFRRECHYIGVQPIFHKNTVQEELLYPFSFNGSNSELDQPFLNFILEGFHLEKSFLTKKLAHLSAGQIQMVRLARGLLLKPKVLLLDEMGSSMDPETFRLSIKLLKKSMEENSLGVLWISHHEDQAREFGKKILKLEEGKIIST